MTTWSERLGRLGVWTHTDGASVADAEATVALIEGLGYGAVWLPETLGRDPFAHIAHLADSTDTLIFATGIASIHHRHPGAMAQAANTLAEQTAGRFVLGLGVSHAPMVSGVRGLPYDKPLSTMRTYLEAMTASPYMAPAPDTPAPRLLAALGPKMLELAATHADGAHPYWTTPEHTATARSILGPDKLLCVEQKVVLTEDAEVARATAVGALSVYRGLPNYRNSWLRLGYTDEEIDGDSPRFLDAVVAWGSADAIRERIREHHDAGADHVCIQPLSPGKPFRLDHAALRALAPNARQ
ncbi:MAG: TIGR03620 family F420-dependent LLM class oxidoreductase [Acidimicrobiales bacterium]